ncbi:MAG: sulfite exporter TauE/SafE family protein [Chloroflexota bacterium]|nr:sulfite exporter TauE/SafE family protein [Chloroflexota bacterium]
MIDLDWARLAVVMLVIGAAAVVKGAIGFGFPLVATPVIATVVDPRTAVLVLSLASLFGNVGMALRGGGSWPTSRRLAPMLLGLLLGTVGGALLLASLDAATLGIVVGLAAMAFALVGTAKPNLAVPTRLERYLAFPMGLAGGLLGGSTSIFAPPIVSYVHALHLAKREFVFFVSMLYTFGGVTQVASYVRLGLYEVPILLLALATCLPNAIGLWIGTRLHDHIDPLLFRRLVLVLIALTGLNLVVRGVWR